MNRSIKDKVSHQRPNLYIHLLFPISVAFLMTFGMARIISYLAPWLYIPIVPGLRIHHFAYGFFVLAASGYLALVFNGPRATYFISLLHGMGLGLVLDEFGIWLHLSADNPSRWSYDGLITMVALILLVVSAKPGVKMLKKIWPGSF